MSEAQGPVRTGTRSGPEAPDREPGAGRGTTGPSSSGPATSAPATSGPVTQAIPLAADAAPQSGTQRAAGKGATAKGAAAKGATGAGADPASGASRPGGSQAAAVPGPATSVIPRTGATPAQQAAAQQTQQQGSPQQGRPQQRQPSGGPGSTGAVPFGAGAPGGPAVAPPGSVPTGSGQRPSGPPTGEQTGSSRVRNAVRGAAGRGPRRAKLQLRHIDTWSALKISLFLSIVLFLVWMVAIAVLYGILSGLGVFDTLNDLFGQLGTAGGAGNTGKLITPGIVFGGAAVIGAVNVVLLTALSTIAAFIYNLGSDLMGGVEVTLSERD